MPARKTLCLAIITALASCLLLLLVDIGWLANGERFINVLTHSRQLVPSLPSYSFQKTKGRPQAERSSLLHDFQTCSINNFLATGLDFLGSAAPIPIEDFIERRNNLANTLAVENIDAFVAEPGYGFQYYCNISQRDWEPWEPEERPFLMVIKPRKRNKTSNAVAETWFLVPEFEAERVRLLDMPFRNPLNIVTWKEHWNPYETLFNSAAFSGSVEPQFGAPKIMVDEEMRDFIQRGLSRHGFSVSGLSEGVEQIRQIKSPREVEILRAVNTGTVEAVRQMRKCLRKGLSEMEVKETLDETLKAGALTPFFDIVLFDEDASNPHGGTGGRKVLDAEAFVLIDVGAHLYGYSSDVSRTFFPPYVPKFVLGKNEMKRDMSAIEEKVHVWNVAFKAQSESIRLMQVNSTAADVDLAARRVINEAGFKGKFTHRLGHGIGIKAHESPYLNKGNTNTSLHAGMVFTSEPGIYLVDKFGVRHEDVLLVQEEGVPAVLSGKRASSPWSP